MSNDNSTREELLYTSPTYKLLSPIKLTILRLYHSQSFLQPTFSLQGSVLCNSPCYKVRNLVIIEQMPSIYYLRQFYPGSYYHIYNRGANKQNIFVDDKDYTSFIKILAYYLLHPLGTAQSILDRVQDARVPHIIKESEGTAYTLLAYCLMPNHFHFMLRQDSGLITITNLMKRLSITYAPYYNARHKHSGSIFQGKYKNVLLTNEYQWFYLSKYIHRNPAHLQSTEPCNLSLYPYSSFQNYLGKKSERWINTSEILGRHDRDPIGAYQRFVEDGSDSGNIEKITLDVNEIQY